MKVVYYIPSIDQSFGGTSTYIQSLVQELGVLLDLHIVTHEGFNPVLIENATIHYITDNYSQIFRIRRDWKCFLHEIQPDIVHIHCCWLPECALFQKWAQQLGYKVILTPHGMLEPWIIKRHYFIKKLPALLLYQKNAVRKADCIHTTAENEKKHILKYNWNNKIVVIPNGINISSAKIKTNWKRKKQILFLSRIHIKKGVEFLIDAIFEIRGQLNGYKIIIAGEGEEKYVNKLLHKVKLLNLDDIIKFVGGIYGEEKWALYQNSDVFILPTFSENFGNVVIESLSSGTPVITTIGTPWSELNSKHCGWYIDIGAKPLSEALLQFLKTSDKELELMGRNGRQLVKDKYSSETIANETYNLYRKLIRE